MRNVILLQPEFDGQCFNNSAKYNCMTKVAGSIPDGVIEIFIDINPSDRTMALGSTQPLTEMSTGSISWG
jgi:hypothetical protein